MLESKRVQVSYKHHFERFLSAEPGRLHFAAHSHHMWPDVTWDAHCQAWQDAARSIDDKWDAHVLSRVLPSVRAHIARIIGLPSGASIAFAPNTHELVVRLVSCLPTPARIVTSDSEFHSFARQCARWEEAGRASVERVPVEPYESFAKRFLRAVSSGAADLVFVSHVFFDSGHVFESFQELASAARDDALIAIDAYHGFMALPTNLSAVAHRVFYLAGGYKYAMSGEGACFMHCPEGYGARPVNTGWFAGFGELASGASGVPYSRDGMRFFGSTFDPSGLYRMAAVFDWLEQIDVSVGDIHRHVQALQHRFQDGIAERGLHVGELVPAASAPRGHFLTFRTPRAAALDEGLAAAQVIVDHRGDRLRFGFGLYQDAGDVDRLLERLAAVLDE